MGRFKALAMPHAFVVGPDGIIVWHGHTNRTQFVSALSGALMQLPPAEPSSDDVAGKKGVKGD